MKKLFTNLALHYKTLALIYYVISVHSVANRSYYDDKFKTSAASSVESDSVLFIQPKPLPINPIN